MVPLTISEAYNAVIATAAFWRALTSDEHSNSPLHSFWLGIGIWINNHRSELTLRAAQLPKLPMELVTVAQRYHDLFLRDCANIGPEGVPDERILAKIQDYQESILTGLNPPVTLPIYVNKLYLARKNAKSDSGGSGGGDGGSGGTGSKSRKKKKRSPGDDHDGSGGDSSSKRKKQKERGERVTNPGRRDADTAHKCLQQWMPFVRKMGAAWPAGVPQTLCLNYHVRGFCFSNCTRDHNPLSNDTWSKLWEGCKQCNS
jgi:hypothetical protein